MGKGGAGEVHLAEDLNGQKVVLKFLFDGGITKNTDQFKREYQHLLRFAHPAVGRALGFGEHASRFFIASEFIEGQSFQPATAEFSSFRMIPLFIQALEGLEAIHTEGLLHLDIKSTNILVTRDFKTKIIDFGVALAMEDLTRKTLRGTPSYMAPEMVLKKGVDNRADLFSMGVLIYFCMTGQYPFPNRKNIHGDIRLLQKKVRQEKPPAPPSSLNPKCPAFLDAIVLQLLAFDPDERFGTARAAINALKTHNPEDYRETPEAKGSYLLPQNDRHIGREKEQKMLFENLARLCRGQKPAKTAFCIHGASGLGKSHLLKKIRETAEKEIEKVSIHFLSLPKKADLQMHETPDWLESWISHCVQKMEENKKPLLILIDDLDAATSPKLNRIREWSKNLMDIVHQRTAHPELYPHSQPLMFCWTEVPPSDAKSPEGIRRGQEKVENGGRGFLSVVLHPFTRDEIRTYLSATPALNGKPISEERLEALFIRTHGNPAELKEHLKVQDSKGLLLDITGQILVAHMENESLSENEATPEIPQRTHHRLHSLLDALTPEEKEAAEWIAVWTWRDFLRSMPVTPLRRKVPGGDKEGRGEVESCLKTMVEKEILVKTGEGYAFPQYSYLPSIIYDNIPETRRQEMHSSIVSVIASPSTELRINSAKQSRSDPFLFHTALSGKDTTALKALLRLGKRCLFEEGRCTIAKYLFERGMAIGEKTDAKMAIFFSCFLIQALSHAGEYKKAEEICNHAASLMREKGISATLRILLVCAFIPVLIEKRNFQKAEQKAAEALVLAKSLRRSYLVPVIMNSRGNILFKKTFQQSADLNSLLEEAKHAFEEGEKMEDMLTPAQHNLVQNNNIGFVEHKLGRYSAAIPKIKATLSRLSARHNIFIEIRLLETLAECHTALRKYDTAIEAALEALQKAGKTGQAKWILHAHHILEVAYQMKGYWHLSRGEKTKARKFLALSLQENTRSLSATAGLHGREELRTVTASILIRKAQCHEELKDWNAAIIYYKAALDQNPGAYYQSVSYAGLCLCNTRKGKFGKVGIYAAAARTAFKDIPHYIAIRCEFKLLQARILEEAAGKKMPALKKDLQKLKHLAGKDRDMRAELRLIRKEIRL